MSDKRSVATAKRPLPVRSIRTTNEPAPAGAPTRRTRRWSVLVGVLLAVLVAAGGFGYAVFHPNEWTAERSIVIVPAASDKTQQAALYDSLSHGQVAATASEIYRQGQWHAEQPGVTVEAAPIPPSAVIQVTASGTDRRAVGRAMSDVVDNATTSVNSILYPYRAVLLDAGTPQPRASGLSRTSWMLIAGFAALLAGAVGFGFTDALLHRLNTTGRVGDQSARGRKPARR